MAPDTETRTLDNFIVRLRKYFETTARRPLSHRSRPRLRFVRGKRPEKRRATLRRPASFILFPAG
jgi:hypothetical protein